jgi:hypothetical protein
MRWDSRKWWRNSIRKYIRRIRKKERRKRRNFFLNFSLLVFSVYFRLSWMRRVECWKLSNVSAYITAAIFTQEVNRVDCWKVSTVISVYCSSCLQGEHSYIHPEDDPSRMLKVIQCFDIHCICHLQDEYSHIFPWKRASSNAESYPMFRHILHLPSSGLLNEYLPKLCFWRDRTRVVSPLRHFSDHSMSRLKHNTTTVNINS